MTNTTGTMNTVRYQQDPPQWVIRVEPDILIKLKRWFAKIPQSVQEIAELNDSPVNAFELLTFVQHFELGMSDMDRAYLEGRAEAHRAKLAKVKRLLSPDYTPRTFTLALPPRDYQQSAADHCIERGSLFCADEMGLGKAQPIDAKVLTPTGWRLMGDLQLGDAVVDPEGGVGHVLGIFPQGERDVFRVNTRDGGSAECCEEHLWEVFSANDKFIGKPHRVLALRDFMHNLKSKPSRGQVINKWFIPVQAPATFSKVDDLPVDPYVLGVLLGDGSLSAGKVSFMKPDLFIVGKVAGRLPPNVEMREDSSSADTWNLTRIGSSGTNPIMNMLRDLGVYGKRSVEKSIPRSYMFASVQERVDLLAGLMDTDGDCSKSGVAMFNTSSPMLRDDVVELVRGLGGIVSVSVREKPKYTHRNEVRYGQTAYRLNVRLPFSPFSLPRKGDRWQAPNMARAIVSVEKLGRKQMQCIRLSTAKSTYVTDGHMVTHNTPLGICVLSAPGSLPAIVTCPKHLTHQWQQQIDRFLPGMRTHIVKTGSYYDLTERRGKRVPFPDVVIVAMSKLHGWAPHLAGIVKCVIADEAHRFRHEWANQNKTVRTRAYGAMLHLRDRVPRRLFLSGTPIYNYGGEAWNVFNALEEDCLGTSTEFAREWCGSQYFNEKASVRDPDALGLHLRKIGAMVRRTREDVKRELPALTKSVEPVDLEDSAALKAVSADVAQFARLVLARNVSGFDKMTAGRELDWRVRQATGIDKAGYIAQFVRMLVESSGPVVLFGWHQAVYKIWGNLLRDLHPVFFTGEQTDRQKEYALDEFLSGRSQVFVMSLRAGEGLDGLQTVSSNVVIGELDWSPKVIEQCIARVHRDGQDKPVFAYMPISDDGSDPVIADALDVKSWQSDGLLNPGAPRVVLLEGGEDHRAQRIAEAWLEKHSPGELGRIRAEHAAAEEAERAAKEKARADAKAAALRGSPQDARQGAASEVG